MIVETEDGAVLRVQVQPRGSRTECVGRQGDALKIRTVSPPVDGMANEELIRFLASALTVPRAAVTIQSGSQSRQKRVKIRGVTAQYIAGRLIPKEREP
ncbi:DUF167 family protein [Nitrospira sp. KM1]|uniref:DUF167 domain-containing protein n=1 Tax=Nitrospira sp. KM1 TaxID=1936990 RepID=UPI0015669039|nr:DUF167 family protein [Nitrospira sp. KM1]